MIQSVDMNSVLKDWEYDDKTRKAVLALFETRNIGVGMLKDLTTDSVQIAKRS